MSLSRRPASAAGSRMAESREIGERVRWREGVTWRQGAGKGRGKYSSLPKCPKCILDS